MFAAFYRAKLNKKTDVAGLIAQKGKM